MATECQPKGLASINVKRRMFICQCGMVGRIVDFYNGSGEKTDDLDEAVTAVIELENGEWNHAVLADFDEHAAVN